MVAYTVENGTNLWFNRFVNLPCAIYLAVVLSLHLYRLFSVSGNIAAKPTTIKSPEPLNLQIMRSKSVSVEHSNQNPSTQDKTVKNSPINKPTNINLNDVNPAHTFDELGNEISLNSPSPLNDNQQNQNFPKPSSEEDIIATTTIHSINDKKEESSHLQFSANRSVTTRTLYQASQSSFMYQLFKDKKNRSTFWSHTVTLVCVISLFLDTVLTTLGFWGLIPKTSNSECRLYDSIRVTFYHIPKIGIYALFLLRLYTVFRDSTYALSKITLYVLLTIEIINMFVMILGDLTFIKGAWVLDSTHRVYFCQTYFATWGLYYTASVDFNLSAITLAMFLYKLRCLLQNVDTKDRKMEALMIKYTLVTFIAVTTTLTTILIVKLLGEGSLVAISNCIDATCIVMMSHLHKEWYECMCCPCHKLCSLFLNNCLSNALCNCCCRIASCIDNMCQQCFKQ